MHMFRYNSNDYYRCYTYDRKDYQFLLMSEDSRHYHLAISYASCPASKKVSLTQEEDGKESRRPIPLGEIAQNIFKNNFELRLRKLELQGERNYEVVGYKQIQEISLRLDRKKQMIHSGTSQTKRVCLSRSSTDKNNHQYLTKQEVIARFSPHYLPTTRTYERSKVNPRLKKQISSMRNIRKNAKKQVGLQLSQKNELFSISKVKNKMEEYQQRWKKQVENKQKLAKKAQKYIQPKITSVIESVDQYRMISENREKQSLAEKLRNITPSMWEKLLRSPAKNLQSTQKQIQHIKSSSALRSVGHAKYRKELLWLEDKDREGYFFKRNDKEAKIIKC